VVSWREFYVPIFHEKKNWKRKNMKKQFDNERDDKGKKVVCFSVKVLGVE